MAPSSSRVTVLILSGSLQGTGGQGNHGKHTLKYVLILRVKNSSLVFGSDTFLNFLTLLGNF